MANPERHRNAAAVMREAWKAEHGAEPTPRELLFALAVADAETNYGRGWKAPCAGSNNWGARQITASEKAKGVPSCEYTDSHPDGTRYPIGFKVYASPVDGARDVVRLLTTQRPETWAVMRNPRGTIYAFSDRMRREKYYGGFCPTAVKAHPGAKVAVYGAPEGKGAAVVACHEEAVAHHAESFVGRRIVEIAAALGLEPPPMGDASDMAHRGGKSGAPGAAGASLLDRLVARVRELVARLRGEGAPVARSSPAGPVAQPQASPVAQPPASPVDARARLEQEEREAREREAREREGGGGSLLDDLADLAKRGAS